MKLNKLFKSSAIIFSLLAIFGGSLYIVNAQKPPEECAFGNLEACEGAQSQIDTVLCSSLTGCINQGLNLLFLAAVILSVIYLLIAGINLIRAGDSGDALKKAKTRVTHAVVGLIIVMLSWAITTLALRTILKDPTQAPEVDKILTIKE